MAATSTASSCNWSIHGNAQNPLCLPASPPQGGRKAGSLLFPQFLNADSAAR